MKYYDKKNPLIETCDFVVTAVTYEGKDGKMLAEGVRPSADDHMVLEGILQRSDVINLNKRTYPKSIWEKQLGEGSATLQKIARGGMLGHLEHPKDGTTDLNLASHLVKEARLQPDGTVTGRIVVLKNVNGQKIESIVRAGGQVGISSRGTGSVDDKGVVQEDYQVETWDVVHNPSTPGAHIAPPKADEAAPAAQEKKIMAEDTSNTETVAEDSLPLTSVEQDVLIKGADYVKGKTGISDQNSLAMVFQRFLKWAKQRGTVDRDIEAAWASFSKIDPLVVGKAPVAAVPAGAEPSAPADKKPLDGENAVPGNKVVPHEAAKAAAGNAVAESAEALLEAARAELATLTEAKAALEAQVATLTESNIKATAELETSRAAITEAQATVSRLQAKVEEQTKSFDMASKTIAALTAVDAAAQVREAIEDAIRSDARLTAFRDSLELQKTPAAVEAKAQAILATLAESATRTTGKATTASLAERIRDRARSVIAEDKGLPAAPAKVLSSEADAADKVEESASAKANHKGAKSAAAAIRKIHD